MRYRDTAQTLSKSVPKIGPTTVAAQLEGIDERARRIRGEETRRLWQSWLRGLAATTSRLSAHLGRHRQERRTRRELAALDDYLLRDIGLSRGEIPYVARLVTSRGRGTLLRTPVAGWRADRAQIERPAQREALDTRHARAA